MKAATVECPSASIRQLKRFVNPTAILNPAPLFYPE